MVVLFYVSKLVKAHKNLCNNLPGRTEDGGAIVGVGTVTGICAYALLLIWYLEG